MEPGTLIANRFRIDRRIGKGGMGEVFAATNVQTGEAVALKLLRAEVKTRRVSMERFRREARAGGFIKSAYVTEILEVDQDPERGIVLVFELLEGESASQNFGASSSAYGSDCTMRTPRASFTVISSLPTSFSRPVPRPCPPP